ncbi:MAG: hypothetical protein A2268_05410 [Candidatus Raymondbacteria bacterium RifOxyA12_full_50_37]|uniref:Uncharacterized protein n=1 Tax=Candidatus Raymondbacteria bacterium RIFOXYD12_FULL_49_13 TaxID=1817890 RepID=A0A1F7FC17_UNCRA|nr:MAG: hypothetical protein A2268_05410 [Candidatus Raymondbacteria bacterium RifOxyA12_full_50_37]OGJ89002.1 MAG: hypothetical protein A2248_02645 [Candidatus Raymondbacteria bacterium RIFOXYA2_FULL_49_16]OGJ92511.1 MAG: hypothetical protein A2350_15790 [Candidatus Raymondbacteria bacterium RifOxyB12_full_50_8]OGJ97029.1 MAG: hypothetical protein A2453_04060 [Candidatus Raymondbacteria bacterium RIFOXYC2_FULL_50_21]OGK04027.1 MAG: hypothetical protein A2519_00800 [Candidatus Raymondbacteria b
MTEKLGKWCKTAPKQGASLFDKVIEMVYLALNDIKTTKGHAKIQNYETNIYLDSLIGVG